MKERVTEQRRETEKPEESGKSQKGEHNKASLFVLFCSEKEGRGVLPFRDRLAEIEPAVCVWVCVSDSEWDLTRHGNEFSLPNH